MRVFYLGGGITIRARNPTPAITKPVKTHQEPRAVILTDDCSLIGRKLMSQSSTPTEPNSSPEQRTRTQKSAAIDFLSRTVLVVPFDKGFVNR